MSIFYDSAYKLKAAWDEGKLTLGSIGIAGFGHDFRSLYGHKSPVSEALYAFQQDSSFRVLLFAQASLEDIETNEKGIFRHS
ncbi:hypothetical protein M378DRAFT_11206 [Amanita muscaria Koide BX008]|uniref:Uncharacterized protein n=1 Tax=Amanita muscaria (strain Koide BX008) TaxID=946122 RepID=A0A0C2WT32_AMAMK|nr:hypothetical protein M378DRAFT_11206 [Amanita muscaria Koide BX008]